MLWEHVLAREGFILYPPGFDPEKVYPVWFQTYGGPHAPTVRDAWGTMLWEHVLAREGFILFRADPYASSGKGARSAWTCYKRLGVNEKDDVVSAVEWLKQRPYVDGSRIGMHGHSFGGYLTSYVMTHSDVLAAGIAGAPVTDWSLYDTIYMERYMLTPQTNPEGYKVTSVINAAKDLKGLLLITHGTMDDNVHFQNTIRLIDALQKAKKQFRTMILPGYRHGLFGDHYRRMMYEFIMELRDRPPAERPESISESLTRG
jgi:dipeptidyl-peptidase-4